MTQGFSNPNPNTAPIIYADDRTLPIPMLPEEWPAGQRQAAAILVAAGVLNDY